MIPGVSPELERILEAGNSAPSGENCQPWRFKVRGDTVEVHLLSQRDQSAYAWGQRASYFACGAVIENMVIAASIERRRPDVVLFPNPQDAFHVATVTFAADPSAAPDDLAPFIAQRISNRKPYKKTPLTAAQKSALLAASRDLALIEHPGDIKKLARIGATNEEIMLANKSLHNFFFSHVSWTKAEDDKNKIGFYIKTLELPPPAQAMFKLFSNWGAMRFLAKLGMNRFVAAQNASTNAAVSAIGAVSVSDIRPLDFVNAGRAVERIWLTATALGLSFQPLTGILFFKLKIEGGEGEAFSPQEQKSITDAYAQAARITGATDGHLAFMFRVGKGGAPSAHAIRFPLAEVVS